MCTRSCDLCVHTRSTTACTRAIWYLACYLATLQNVDVTLSFRDLCLSCTSVYSDTLTFTWSMHSCQVPAIRAGHYLFQIRKYLFIVQIHMWHYFVPDTAKSTLSLRLGIIYLVRGIRWRIFSRRICKNMPVHILRRCTLINSNFDFW